MIVSHQHKFVFIHIPKTAGTAVTEALRPHIPDGIVGDGQTQHALLSYHAPAWDVQRAFEELGWDWEGYQKFVIMRNPFEILHSDYWFHRYIGESLFKDAPPEKSDPEYVWHLKCHESQYLTFTEYCLRSYGHWDRGFYHNYACSRDRKQIVDCVLQQNDLQYGWKTICLQLGIAEAQLPLLNATRQVSGKDRPNMKADFTPGLINWVKARFSDDLKRFQYSWEPAS